MIEIKRPDLRMIQVTIFGTSPLICHRWSEKAKKEMLDKQVPDGKMAGKIQKFMELTDISGIKEIVGYRRSIRNTDE